MNQTTEPKFTEKLPSKKLDRLLDRLAVLEGQVRTQIAKEYRVGILCQFRQESPGSPQLCGRIVDTDTTVRVLTATGDLHIVSDLLDIRRVDRSDILVIP